jgi:hypothetical protein
VIGKRILENVSFSCSQFTFSLYPIHNVSPWLTTYGICYTLKQDDMDGNLMDVKQRR